MQPFLKSVAKTFVDNLGPQIREYCFVFPNKRSSLFFKKYLTECFDTPFFSPGLTTVSELFGSLSELVTYNKVMLLHTLYKVYMECLPDSTETFDSFIYWGDILLNDFDDIDKYLVDAESLYRNIKDLKELDDIFSLGDFTENQKRALESFWGVVVKEPGKMGKNTKSFLNMWDSLYPIYRKFREQLYAQGGGYEGMIFRMVADSIADDDAFEAGILPKLNRYRKIVFVGLNALNECEKRLMRKLRNLGKGDFYWDYQTPELKDEDNSSSRFMKENVREFTSFYPIEYEVNVNHPEINVVSFSSSTASAKYTGTLLRELKSDNKNEDLFNTCIVLPDESLLFPLLSSIPEEVEKVNVTMGYSLSNSNVASLFLNLYSLRQGMRELSSGPSFYYRNVMDIISHPIVKRLHREFCERTIKEIISKNMVYVPLTMLSEIEPLFRGGQDIAEYLLGAIDFITGNEASNNIERLEREFVLAYQKNINLLSTILADTKVTSSTFFKLLSQLTSLTSIPFTGEPLAGVQIMGPLETRALDFDNVIILSMNDGVFPSRSISNSIIPYNLRKGFGLPTYEYQDSIGAYHFYRSLSRAKRVWLMSDTSSQGGRTSEESRYIKQLEYHHRFVLNRYTVSSAVSMIMENNIIFHKNQSILEKLMKQEYSPSAISLYRDCPVRFYFQYIENLREDDEVREEIGADIFGSLFHKAMELIYTDDNSAHHREKRYIESIVDKAFLDILMMKSEDIRGRNLVIRELLKRYVTYTLEADRLVGGLVVMKTEKVYKCRFCIDAQKELFVTLKGIVDRIDSTEIGNRVVDYKTGRVNVKTGIEPKHLDQLYFYLLLLTAPENRILPGIDRVTLDIFYVREGYRKSYREAVPSEESFNAFKEEMKETLLEILNPDADFVMTDDLTKCGYCPFKDICNR